MISIKSDREISLVREAGRLNYLTHEEVKKHIKPGVKTKDLDKVAYDFIIKNHAKPSFLNYEGYPASICVSINDEVVHGIPGERRIMDGDVVGHASKEVQDLVKNTELALIAGLQKIHEGAKIGDIGSAIEDFAHAHGLSVVEELVGHGVGTNIHEDPDVPNYGRAGVGVTLRAGMVLAVEPMLNLGERYVYLHDDDWTISTEDGLPSAHFEHTVVVTKDGYKILTGEN